MNFEEFKEAFEKKPVEEYKNESPEKPKVSVVVQTYQHGKFISQCIESVLAQKTNFEFEFLIGEDQSTDETRQICLDFAKRYPGKIRLFLHHRENSMNVGGTPTGRFNFLYNLYSSKGKYVAYCDGDDYWTDPLKLQKQIDFLEAHPSFSGCFTNAIISNEIIRKKKKFSEHCGDREYTIYQFIHGGGGMFPSASLVFRNLEKDYPEFMYKIISGDRALSLILANTGPFYFLNDLTCVYRRHIGGLFSGDLHNLKRRTHVNKDNIQLLNSFNEFTNRKYHKCISEAISHLRLTIMIHNKIYPHQKEFYEYFKALSFRHKLSYAKRYF